MTIGLFGGADGGALWFIFFKVDGEPRKGLDFPRWTQEQGEEVCRKYSHAKLTEKTMFGDVFANRYRLTTQACPNHCLRTWHWGRLICLGDSVAKTNPILAQGGAQGAESVMTLIDLLHDALKQRKDGERLPTEKVEGILKTVNEKREPRVRDFVNKSQQIMRIFAWTTWLYRLVGRWISPLLPTWVIVAQALGPWKGAYQSTSLPPPKGSNGISDIGQDGADGKCKSGVDVKSVTQSSS